MSSARASIYNCFQTYKSRCAESRNTSAVDGRRILLLVGDQSRHVPTVDPTAEIFVDVAHRASGSHGHAADRTAADRMTMKRRIQCRGRRCCCCPRIGATTTTTSGRRTTLVPVQQQKMETKKNGQRRPKKTVVQPSTMSSRFGTRHARPVDRHHLCRRAVEIRPRMVAHSTSPRSRSRHHRRHCRRHVRTGRLGDIRRWRRAVDAKGPRVGDGLDRAIHVVVNVVDG